MQSLRRARFIARLVLAWFALSIGIAVAAPLVNPQAIELICSGSGAMKLLVKNDDGSTTSAGHTLDCPLCASLDAPPPVARFEPQARPAISHTPQGMSDVRIAARAAAPPPGRGPPSRFD